jgi:IS1 family transposase
MRCGKTFSEIQPLSETRIDSAKGAQIVHLLCEGVGIRAISRLAGVHKQTVLNVLRSAGVHCAALLDAKLRNLKPSHVEIDEIWTFVQKKAFHALDHPVFGDQYCWLSLDEQTKLILNFQVAKRTNDAAHRFISDLKSRLADVSIDLTTDGFTPYLGRTGAVYQNFGLGVNYGTEIKSFGLQDPHGHRRYSPLVCTSCRREVQSGGRERATITVNHAERQNLNVRLFNRRFTRLTLGYSKKLANLEHAVALFVAFHNFCRVHSAHKQTPAQAFGLTDHAWSIAELLAATI